MCFQVDKKATFTVMLKFIYGGVKIFTLHCVIEFTKAVAIT